MLIESHRLLRSSLLATALAFGGIPTLAYAQQQEQGADAPGTVPEASGPGDNLPEVTVEAPMEGEDEVIVVTGSVIERRDLTTPAPLAIVDKEELDASGLASVGDVLQNLPSQSNAINIQFNNGGDGSTRISLRGLGSGRTLVLLNGRRHVPGGTGANSSVDLNAIPMAIVERVEVLKDGASAIYGSDAIGGVVNIITRRDFKGTEAAIYTGSTGDGLAQVYDVSVANGHSSKRGNIIFSAGYFEQQPMWAGERDFSKSDFEYLWDAEEGEERVITLGSTSVPEGYIRDRTFETDPGNAAWQEIVANSCPSLICFNDPGSGWRDFRNTGVYPDGDQYNYQPDNYLVTPQQRYNIFSSGNYQFTDNLNGFFEASYTNRTSEQLLAAEPIFTLTEGLVVSANNVYNPFGKDFIDVRRRMVEAGNRIFSQDLNTFRFVGGVEGKLPTDLLNLPKGWRWSLSYNYGITQGTDVNQGRLILSRLQEAIGPSYLDDEGVARCGTPDSPGSSSCVPLDLFGGVGSITPEMLKYVTYTGIANGFTEQKSVALNTTGRLFSTPWGGDVALAVGAEYRNENGASIPDPITASGDTTGNKSEPTAGGFDVYEAYSELSVVPVVGKEFAEWIELNGAVRVFNYSTFGSDATWKAGGLWRMTKGFSLRGTYSTAFRAPSIGELYSGQADDFPSVTDPCNNTPDDPRDANEQANCAADGLPDDYSDDRVQIRSRVGGNPEVGPETANIFTLGTVYEPTFLPNFAFTLDYFNINIENAIQPAGASVILSNCYARAPGERTDCDKIIRNDQGYITAIINTETNIGGSETSGIDFSARYDHNTTVGRFRYNLEGTWLHKYDEILDRRIHGKDVYDLGVFPDWKFNFATLWGYKQFGAGLNIRFINGFKECQDNDCSVQDETMPPPERKVDSNTTGDIFASYSVESSVGKSRLTVGINNVLNQEPAVIYNGFLASSDASTYDFLGRYFYARFVQSF